MLLPVRQLPVLPERPRPTTPSRAKMNASAVTTRLDGHHISSTAKGYWHLDPFPAAVRLSDAGAAAEQAGHLAALMRPPRRIHLPVVQQRICILPTSKNQNHHAVLCGPQRQVHHQHALLSVALHPVIACAIGALQCKKKHASSACLVLTQHKPFPSLKMASILMT